MGLPKGKTNNPKGRKKGSQNTVTKELRELIKEFLNENFEQVKRDFKKLDTKTKLYFYKELLKYAVPTISATQMDFTDTTEEKQITDIVIHHVNIDPFQKIRENAGIDDLQKKK